MAVVEKSDNQKYALIIKQPKIEKLATARDMFRAMKPQISTSAQLRASMWCADPPAVELCFITSSSRMRWWHRWARVRCPSVCKTPTS